MPQPPDTGDPDEQQVAAARLKNIGGELPLYRLPFDEIPGWYVSNGNWDDPGPGHGLDQAYAFDIRHLNVATDRKVRAARSGYVAMFRNDLPDNTDGWDAKRIADYVINHPGVTKQALGGGSHVMIRHSDDTVAAYAHLKPYQSNVTRIGQFVSQGELIGLADDTGSSTDPHLHIDVRLFWNGYLDNQHGPTVPIQFMDGNHAAWRPRDGEPLSPVNHYRFQDAWYWCRKCLGLFYGAKPLSGDIGGRCPADGLHERGSDVNYVVAFSTVAIPAGQSGWRWCQRCQGLFYGDGATSVCPANGVHQAGSGNYSVVLNMPEAPGQHGFRWCQRCQGLWLEGAGSDCPAGGAHHIGSGDYMLWRTRRQSVQQHWRYCGRCQGLFYADNPGSVCPAGAGGHVSGTLNYVLVHDMADAPGQPGWRWCGRCQGLFYGVNPGSVCPAGEGGHVPGTGMYTLVLNRSDAPGQSGWRWCGRCQGMFFGDNPGSVCPAGAGGHVSGTGTYSLHA